MRPGGAAAGGEAGAATSGGGAGEGSGGLVSVVMRRVRGSVRQSSTFSWCIQGEAIGQGHEELGRYAKGVGVNPFKILSPVFDKDTGELAMYATRVKVSKTGQHEKMVKDEGDSHGKQAGTKIVATLPSDKVNLAREV